MFQNGTPQKGSKKIYQSKGDRFIPGPYQVLSSYRLPSWCRAGSNFWDENRPHAKLLRLDAALDAIYRSLMMSPRPRREACPGTERQPSFQLQSVWVFRGELVSREARHLSLPIAPEMGLARPAGELETLTGSPGPYAPRPQSGRLLRPCEEFGERGS